MFLAVLQCYVTIIQLQKPKLQKVVEHQLMKFKRKINRTSEHKQTEHNHNNKFMSIKNFLLLFHGYFLLLYN